MEDAHTYLGFDTKSFVGTNVPIQRRSQTRIKLPDEINAFLHIRTPQQNTPDGNGAATETYYREQYERSSQMYQLQFDIPLLQQLPGEHNIDNPTPNHMFLHLHLTGHYERKLVQSYCRVETATACVLHFPVFMTESEQAHVLRHLPSDRGDTRLLRLKHSFLTVYSLQDINRAYSSVVHPEAKEYDETSKKSRLMRHMESADSLQLTQMNTYLSAADSALIPKGQARTPAHSLAKLKYFYGPNVKVKELDGSMDVLQENQIDVYTWSERLHQIIQHVTSPTYTIAQLLQHTHLETYLRCPHKLAVVAVLPLSHRLHSESIVASVLFTFVPPTFISKTNQTKDARTTLAYLRLDDICIDCKYDEYVLDKNHYSDKKGIRSRLLTAATEYADKVFGAHNLVYNGNGTTTMISFLKQFGFKLKEVSKTRTTIQRLYALVDTSKPVYIRKTAATKCSNWEECKATVAEQYPNLGLKQKLILASKLYDKATDTATRKPRRNHYPVRASTGVTILQQYYAQKYLHPYNIQLRATRKAYEKQMLDEDAKKQLGLYCTAIRNHLRRSRKHIELSTEKNNTWKFRPSPEAATDDADGLVSTTTTAQTTTQKALRRSGPDKYGLHGLDAETEPGRSLLAMPLGRSTPAGLRETSVEV
jgi:hypothetical protein